MHDPGKVLLDLAVAVAIGGDCLADIAMLRAEPGVFGQVASDPTVSRMIDRLAGDAATRVGRDQHRPGGRPGAGVGAGRPARPRPQIDAGAPLIIDVDATLVTAHSEKEGAAATFKRGFGHHPLWAWVDHGPGGTGEPLTMLLRRATPEATPPPITSSSARRCANSLSTAPGAGPGGRS